MSPGSPRRSRVGAVVDDMCRACKTERRHTVMATGADGAVARVVCDYCGSQHNYRGGARRTTPRGSSGTRRADAPSIGREPLPLVTDRERSHPPMTHEGAEGNAADLELMLRRVIREETGLTPVAPAEKWRGGEIALRPREPGLKEKTIPIETLFQKVVMVRNRLRVLEQQINSADLPADVKVKLQSHITGCYGSLTTFNVLFADEEDRFKGTGSD